MNIEWQCSDCANVFTTDEQVFLHCPECGSHKLFETNQPEPDPQGEQE